MSDDIEDKQHEATGRRLDDLRKQGTILRSKDFSGALIFGAVIILLAMISTHLVESFKENFYISYSNFKDVISNHDLLTTMLKTIALKTFYLLLPIYIISLVVTILTPFLLGGWNFTLSVFNFDLSKLDVVANIARMFSPKQALIEICKSFLKSLVFLAGLVFFLLANKHLIINLVNQPVIPAINSSVNLINEYIITLVAAVVFVVVFDIYYNLKKYQRDTRMSTQEIKDQSKDADGSPEVKQKIKSRQMALIKQRLRQSVPKANVIITNPTHYAVALRYDSANDNAPKVVAKGKDLIAWQIRQIGIAHAVTIYEAPELARAVYHTTKVGATIHPALYKAVALVLTYVYQLKNYQMGNANLPQFVSNLEIPQEFIFKE